MDPQYFEKIVSGKKFEAFEDQIYFGLNDWKQKIRNFFYNSRFVLISHDPFKFVFIVEKGLEAEDERVRAQKAMRIPAESGFSFDVVPEMDWSFNFVITSKRVNDHQRNRVLDFVAVREFDDCTIEIEDCI